MKWTGWVVTAIAGGVVWFGGGALLSSLNILKVSIIETPFILSGWFIIAILCFATHVICNMIREGQADAGVDKSGSSTRQVESSRRSGEWQGQCPLLGATAEVISCR